MLPFSWNYFFLIYLSIHFLKIYQSLNSWRLYSCNKWTKMVSIPNNDQNTEYLRWNLISGKANAKKIGLCNTFTCVLNHIMSLLWNIALRKIVLHRRLFKRHSEHSTLLCQNYLLEPYVMFYNLSYHSTLSLPSISQGISMPWTCSINVIWLLYLTFIILFIVV